jgi:hypothetical protein
MARRVGSASAAKVVLRGSGLVMHLTYVLINIMIKYTLAFALVNFLRCGKPQLGYFSFVFILQRATGRWFRAIST